MNQIKCILLRQGNQHLVHLFAEIGGGAIVVDGCDDHLVALDLLLNLVLN